MKSKDYYQILTSLVKECSFCAHVSSGHEKLVFIKLVSLIIYGMTMQCISVIVVIFPILAQLLSVLSKQLYNQCMFIFISNCGPAVKQLTTCGIPRKLRSNPLEFDLIFSFVFQRISSGHTSVSGATFVIINGAVIVKSIAMKSGFHKNCAVSDKKRCSLLYSSYTFGFELTFDLKKSSLN